MKSLIFVKEVNEETGKVDLKLEELPLEMVCDLRGYKIVNIVASGKLLDENQNVDLSKMARADPTTRYNPDAFSGLWKPIRFTNSKGVALKKPVCHIFDPGTFVMMGFTDMNDVEEAYGLLKEEVQKYPDEKRTYASIWQIRVQSV